MKASSPHPTPQILFSSAGRGWRGLEAALVHMPAGIARAPGGDLHVLGMHFGPPVNADCAVGGTRRTRRLQKPGDIDLIPAGVDGTWEDDADCQILRLGLRPSHLTQVAEALGRKVALSPRLQVRDARIEAICWAIKAELEADAVSDPLFIDHLANALAVRLIATAAETDSLADRARSSRLSARKLRVLTELIEANLDQRLQLADLAAFAGVSVTRLKTLFRNSTGTSVHQYVIRRRIEYARALIATTTMPVSQVALAAGFAHQSHLASTMRRVLGLTPGEIARSRRET